jgi:hypothetical protein
MQRSRPSTVVTVTMQWPPGKPAWFWSYFDKTSGARHAWPLSGNGPKWNRPKWESAQVESA